jgi:putative alpha-1,2-mannosidase
LFENVSIETGGGKSFTLTARNVSDTTKYIQSATINGNPLNRLYITHNEILQGVATVFEMGDVPNLTWGVNDVAVPPTDMK